MDTLKITMDSLSIMLDKIPGLLQENVDKLEDIKRNTGLDFFDDGMNLLAVLSIIIAVAALIIEAVTWFGITWTRESIISESEKNRVDKECQYRLFQDIIRHLYRNKVCTMTMQVKSSVKQREYDEKLKSLKEDEDNNNKITSKIFYPSEEHILKLKLLPSDIHLEEYYRDVETYHKLHEIELQLRNYNTEIDTAYLHLPNPKVDIKTKERDYGTLNFKAGYLTLKIIKLMNVMWPEKDNEYDAVSIILSSQDSNNRENSIDPTVYESYYDRIKEFMEKERGDWYVKELFNKTGNTDAFLEGLLNDVLIECGTNSRKEEKIHIVELDI